MNCSSFKNECASSNEIYILKKNVQRKEGLKLTQNFFEIIDASKENYKVVQKYITDLYLVNGRKINLRIYVLVIKDTYGNIKLLVYQDGFMYYTPELFEKNDTSFERNITTGYVDRQIYIDNPLTHNDFRNFLDDPNRKKTIIEEYYNYAYKNKLSNYIFSQIYQLIGTIFKTYENIIGTNLYGVGFQLYGVDIAINEKLQPMIMEINKGPDLKAKDDRDRELKTKLCTDILKSIGLLNPIDNSEENNFVLVLELINIDDKLIPIKTL
jgi:tubulin polyglutamylase TTLL9